MYKNNLSGSCQSYASGVGFFRPSSRLSPTACGFYFEVELVLGKNSRRKHQAVCLNLTGSGVSHGDSEKNVLPPFLSHRWKQKCSGGQRSQLGSRIWDE